MSQQLVHSLKLEYGSALNDARSNLQKAKHLLENIPEDISVVKRRCILSIRNNDVYNARCKLEDVTKEAIVVRRLVSPIDVRMCNASVSNEERDRARMMLSTLSKDELLEHILDFKSAVFDEMGCITLKRLFRDGYDVDSQYRCIDD
jgi:hypothetical protein